MYGKVLLGSGHSSRGIRLAYCRQRRVLRQQCIEESRSRVDGVFRCLGTPLVLRGTWPVRQTFTVSTKSPEGVRQLGPRRESESVMSVRSQQASTEYGTQRHALAEREKSEQEKERPRDVLPYKREWNGALLAHSSKSKWLTACGDCSIPCSTIRAALSTFPAHHSTADAPKNTSTPQTPTGSTASTGCSQPMAPHPPEAQTLGRALGLSARVKWVVLAPKAPRWHRAPAEFQPGSAWRAPVIFGRLMACEPSWCGQPTGQTSLQLQRLRDLHSVWHTSRPLPIGQRT